MVRPQLSLTPLLATGAIQTTQGFLATTSLTFSLSVRPGDLSGGLALLNQARSLEIMDPDKKAQIGRSSALIRKIQSMTQEERKEWYRTRENKSYAAREASRVLKYFQAPERVTETAAMILKEVPTTGDYKPSQKVLDELWKLVDNGFDIERIREHLGQRGYSEKAWQAIKRELFKGVMSQTEDMGLRLEMGVRFALGAIKAEITYMKAMQRKKPFMYSKEIVEASETYSSIQMDYSKALINLGLVDSKKSGGGGVHVHINTPRPEKVVESVTVEKDGDHQRVPTEPLAAEVSCEPNQTQGPRRGAWLHEGGHDPVDVPRPQANAGAQLPDSVPISSGTISPLERWVEAIPEEER